jgi:hypothetical protein
MTSEQLAQLIAENSKLFVERREVFERILVPSSAIEALDADGKVLEGGKVADAKSARFTAKVGEADTVNQNKRIYPRREWAAAVDKAENVKIPAGMLGGSTDHAGFLDGGNFKNRSVLWKSLKMDAAGYVTGEFVIPDTTAGRDLKAWKDAGGAVGFSTYGYAKAHEPTDEERKAYGLAEDEYAIIIEDYELVAIDAVDNPSVRSAWMNKESVGRPANEGKAVGVVQQLADMMK